jgi:hypothetical protein
MTSKQWVDHWEGEIWDNVVREAAWWEIACGFIGRVSYCMFGAEVMDCIFDTLEVYLPF